ALTLIHLPDGPTAHFKLSGISLTKDIAAHGRYTGHLPELILNNFNTRLGHTVGRMIAALFPHVPEFQGRTVATFHNQRDFIFFRRSR
ncbi:MAG: anticodon-binding protein, partial [Olpidium bornovanus]